MTRRNHAPVSIPAGSFDRAQLQDGLDAAATAKPEDRQEAVSSAFSKAAGEGGFKVPDASLAPGQKFIDREHEELGITERVRVFDPDSEEGKRQAEQAERDTELLDRQSAALAERAAAAEPDVEAEPEVVAALGKGAESKTAGDGDKAGQDR